MLIQHVCLFVCSRVRNIDVSHRAALSSLCLTVRNSICRGPRSHELPPCYNRRACGHVDMGTRPHQVLAATLIISQPGGADYAHPILVSTPSFEIHRRACSAPKGQLISKCPLGAIVSTKKPTKFF